MAYLTVERRFCFTVERCAVHAPAHDYFVEQARAAGLTVQAVDISRLPLSVDRAKRDADVLALYKVSSSADR